MSRSALKICLILFFLTPNSLHSQATSSLKILRFHERDGVAVQNNDSRPRWALVSGGLRGLRGVIRTPGVGSSTGSDAGTASFPTMYFSGIGEEDKSICLRVISIDGLYEANALIEVTKKARLSGEAELTLPSSNSRLKGFKSNEIGALARVSSTADCSAASAIIPVAWSMAELRSPIRILIGGAGRPGRPVVRPSIASRSVPCTTLLSEMRSQTAFRFACSDTSNGCYDERNFRISWVTGPRREPLFNLKIRGHCDS